MKIRIEQKNGITKVYISGYNVPKNSLYNFETGLYHIIQNICLNHELETSLEVSLDLWKLKIELGYKKFNIDLDAFFPNEEFNNGYFEDSFGGMSVKRLEDCFRKFIKYIDDIVNEIKEQEGEYVEISF